MNITVEVEKSENCVVDLAVGVPAEELDRRKDAILDKWRERANVPGFRKGHVPKAILERQFGQQAAAEGLDDLLKEAVRAAFEKQELHPVDTPKVTDLKTDNGQIRFKLSVEVRPVLRLTDDLILKIPLPKPAQTPVTDEDVTAAMTNELKTESTFVPVLDPRPSQRGDFVAVDYEGFLKENDQPIEGAKADGAMIELGAMKFLPGFDDQVAGMSPGDKRRVEIAFPADFYDDGLQGKAAYFHVTLKTIKKRQMPEATDDWAKERGYESLADARTKIRAEMERGAAELAQEETRRALFEALDARIQIELPGVMVARQVDELGRNLERRYKGGRKELLEQLQKEGKSETDLEAELFQRARRQIKNSLILDAVSKLKNIQVDDSDIETKIAKMADEYRTTPDVIRAELGKQDKLDDIRYTLLDEKVVQFLLDHADIR
ncbi:trigger factor [bacterium]|nr:trigger factor [bacterium]